ncbi:unnamed protein product [Blepharisma stoltei]|uniref:Uncharacterized protein n=1 Tax=Blepharisma stoltei TaxID=1481888 RepID=A0AAU9IPZ2_9CILI|nr:unnamed protein product [Blepharisma stoltei]
MDISSKFSAQAASNDDLDSTILNINKAAVDALRNDEFSLAVSLLNRANHLLKQLSSNFSVLRLKGITLNNLGCLYKQKNQFSKSLDYLFEALEYERKLPHYINLAGTYLNICSLFSVMGNHKQSLENAVNAIKTIEQHNDLSNEWVKSWVVAYQNAADSARKLGDYNEAEFYMKKGYEIALKKLGKNHEITKNFIVKKQEPSESSLTLESYMNSSTDEIIKEKNFQSFLPDLRLKQRNLLLNSPGEILLDTTPWQDGSHAIGPWTNLTGKTEEKINNFEQTNENSWFSKKKSKTSLSPTSLLRKNTSKNIDRVNKDKPRHKKQNSEVPFENPISLDQKNTQKIQNIGRKKPKLSIEFFKLPATPISHSNGNSTKRSIHLDPINPIINQPKSVKHNFPIKNKFIKQTSPITKTIHEKLDSIGNKLSTIKKRLNKFENVYKNPLKNVPEENSVKCSSEAKSADLSRKTLNCIVIQTFIRRWLCRKKFLKMKNAARVIQRWFRRSFNKRRKEKYNLKDFSQQFSPKHQEKSSDLFAKTKTLFGTLTYIQARIRGFLARKRYQRTKAAIIKIQKNIKMFSVRSLYKIILDAIMFIQANIRGHLVRKVLKLKH